MTGWLCLLLSLADTSAAQETRAPVIWYRASESCPSAPAFLEKLTESGHPVRPAQGGDHIDFVVTLVAAKGQTVGRLERQTQGGTVAIRELRDATCTRVADALALSLGLAVDPKALDSASEPAVETAPVPVVQPEPEPVREPPSQPALSAANAPPIAIEVVPVSSHAAQNLPLKSARWSVGVSLGALSGVATHPVPRGEAFVTLERAWSRTLPELSLRLGLLGAFGSFSTPLGAVQRTLLAARAEACPVRVGSARLAVRPCLVTELGLTRVAEDRPPAAASSLWWAPGIGLRGELGLTRRLRLEVSAGALVPIPRHYVAALDSIVYRDAIIVFSGTLGVSLLLP